MSDLQMLVAIEDNSVVITAQSFTPSSRCFWQDLEKLKFVELRCSGSRTIIAKCRASGMTPEPASSSTSTSTILAKIGDGRGFSMVLISALIASNEFFRYK